MSAEDAELLRLLDGERSLHELVVGADGALGPRGPARLAALLADLGERGLLEGTRRAEPAVTTGLARASLQAARRGSCRAPAGVRARVPRVAASSSSPRPSCVLVALVAVGRRRRVRRPRRPADRSRRSSSRARVGARRPRLPARPIPRRCVLHELAHGLTVASFGRRVPRAGLKLVLIFPYAFVDTSEAWFEPRRRRLAISAAGPSATSSSGAPRRLSRRAGRPASLRDVVFQLAFAAYIGAFYNLNPHARPRRLPHARRPPPRAGPAASIPAMAGGHLTPRHDAWGRGRVAFGIYAATAFGWSILTALFTFVISRHYYEQLVAIAPTPVVGLSWRALPARLRARRSSFSSPRSRPDGAPLEEIDA